MILNLSRAFAQCSVQCFTSTTIVLKVIFAFFMRSSSKFMHKDNARHMLVISTNWYLYILIFRMVIILNDICEDLNKSPVQYSK